MGPITKTSSTVASESSLFGDGLTDAKAPRHPSVLAVSSRGFDKQLPPPSQTNSKSKLIAEYIERFQLVTKGGLFIDGFAAPQSRNHPEAWTARRVLELEPKRLRRFWLCELDPGGAEQLRALKKDHNRQPRFRHVSVMEGDFNQTVDGILASRRIKPTAATFAFLDQRNMECHWETVRKLADFKRKKIEIMYFLGTSWSMRSLKSASRPEKFQEIEKWWGRSDWRSLIEVQQSSLPLVFADRFTKELGYGYVNIYPILLKENGTKVAFHLIHASDHPQAPVLMTRAYRKVCGEIANSPADNQMDLLTWEQP